MKEKGVWGHKCVVQRVTGPEVRGGGGEGDFDPVVLFVPVGHQQ